MTWDPRKQLESEDSPPAVPLQLLTLPTELSAAQHATCNPRISREPPGQ